MPHVTEDVVKSGAVFQQALAPKLGGDRTTCEEEGRWFVELVGSLTWKDLDRFTWFCEH